MKRNIAIAAVTAAVLIGGGAVTTAAFAGDDSSRAGSATSGAQAADSPRSGDRIDVEDAVAAALKAVPGTVTEAELDAADDDCDDDRRSGTPHWDVDITGKDGTGHELRVDAKTGKVTADHDDRADDRGDDRDDD